MKLWANFPSCRSNYNFGTLWNINSHYSLNNGDNINAMFIKSSRWYINPSNVKCGRQILQLCNSLFGSFRFFMTWTLACGGSYGRKVLTNNCSNIHIYTTEETATTQFSHCISPASQPPFALGQDWDHDTLSSWSVGYLGTQKYMMEDDADWELKILTILPCMFI